MDYEEAELLGDPYDAVDDGRPASDVGTHDAGNHDAGAEGV